ncbi:MAG TPA: FHA domain-containing protein [Vicinamibacterales bacterium]|jgi:DNA-binding winged helix-turn-helix (wHTH) protein|nr:FHA domain-containing protein [Vicinamibacterales bacterium]
MTYRFGRFSADSATRQLLADGREVHLSPKAFELLCLLIEHRARALPKAELHERLWPSTFVGETNLPALVAEIRRALGDSAHDPAYVRTVHRFGYRFVAAVGDALPPPVVSDKAMRMYLTSGDRQFPLAEGGMTIGRAGDAAIRIDSGAVSRHHARVVVTGGEARVEDLGSKNGTFVDGKPIAGLHLLLDGDEIRVGPVALTFRLAPANEATETLIGPPSGVQRPD